MSTTRVFTIVPNPHWVIIDNFSKLPNGAAIYTYRSLDPQTFKPAFQDAAGTIPYGQPIVGFGNGTMPPIFWEFDPMNPTDTYYIRVYDKENVPGAGAQFLWDFNGLSGSVGSGGGTVVTTTNIENLVVNNILINNIGGVAGTPSLPTFISLAPSNHSGYAPTADPNFGFPSPDISFQKNNTTASDSISFVNFTPPLGINALPGGESTPEQYVQYDCTAAGSGETFKYVQFPISKGVQSLSQQMARVKIYAKCTTGNQILKLFWRQFYGAGGAPSPDQIVQINGDITLTTDWDSFSLPSVIPDATLHVAGSCGNDALFLLVSFPLDAVTSIAFIKPAVYLGNVAAPAVDFVSNDSIDSIVNSPRTGDVRVTTNNYLFGWVVMNDGTIGNAASASALSARANVDTFPLFNLIWLSFFSNQALAPMVAGGTTGPAIPYGPDPVTDFVLNRQISLTKVVGRALAAASGLHILGSTEGTNEMHTLIPQELPDPLTRGAKALAAAAGGGFLAIQSDPGTNGAIISNFGGNTPFSIVQPTSYFNVFIKL